MLQSIHMLAISFFLLIPLAGIGQGTASQPPGNKKVELRESPANGLAGIAESRPQRYDSLLLNANLQLAKGILSGEREFYDSTALKLIQTHPEWKGAVLVIDWTASMFQQGAQIFSWLDSLTSNDYFSGLVVFNDGDGRYDDEKEVGFTGGIYQTGSCHRDSLSALLEMACLGGNGGDHRENDLEALLFAQSAFPNSQRFILIADNRGPIRDMSLINLLEHNFEILLCSVHKGNINSDYINLADQTDASIFTSETILDSISNYRKQRILPSGEYCFLWEWDHWVKGIRQH